MEKQLTCLSPKKLSDDEANNAELTGRRSRAVTGYLFVFTS